MTPEQRQELMRLLEKGEEISPEWARILFPPAKREYELVYHGKDREEDIIADTLAVPLQAVRTFGRDGVDWHNMLIFGDNTSCSADSEAGTRRHLIMANKSFVPNRSVRPTLILPRGNRHFSLTLLEVSSFPMAEFRRAVVQCAAAASGCFSTFTAWWTSPPQTSLRRHPPDRPDRSP